MEEEAELTEHETEKCGQADTQRYNLLINILYLNLLVERRVSDAPDNHYPLLPHFLSFSLLYSLVLFFGMFQPALTGLGSP